LSALLAAGGLALAGGPPPPAQSDLDQFMERVIARRDENWKRLQQYILDEREQFEVRGPLNVPIWGQRREYTWYIREGFFVRSPRTADGVTVSEEERRKYEEDFLRRAKARERQGDSADAARGAEDGAQVLPIKPAPEADTPDDMSAFLSQTSRPQFIDSAYFLRFRFETGKYALVGRETFEGRQVLRIEYYPTQMFGNRRGRGRGGAGDPERQDREDATGAAIGRLMNKVAMITLWVDPESHQIVKYTFDNLHLDFLPAAWLVRLDDISASMTMGQPFAGVWLPRDIDMHFGATMASGSITARYRIDYHDYREPVTSGRIQSVVQP
jgi:hypothetical protein